MKINAMKTLLLLIIFLPMLAFGQKAKSQISGEIKDLKELPDKYCVVFNAASSMSAPVVQTTEDQWDLIDDLGKKLKLKTSAALINYMDKNGWEYVSTYVNTLDFHVFKRKP